jgi:hypothetical protein
MQSSKRKFNALLNGLGNRSTSNLSEVNKNGPNSTLLPHNSENDSQTKRPRTSRPGSILNTASHARFSSSSKVDMPHKKSSSASAVPTSKDDDPSGAVPDDGPKYNPYDREAFLVRLKTFNKLLDWSPKPDRVEAVAWAKRGWVCKKNERVRCDYCYVELLVKLNVKEINGVEEAVEIPSHIGMFLLRLTPHVLY